MFFNSHWFRKGIAYKKKLTTSRFFYSFLLHNNSLINMCIFVHQVVGYSVPSKKVEMKRKSNSNYNEVFDGIETYDLSHIYTIFVTDKSMSTCRCKNEYNNSRYSRDTYKPLIFDEDDMKSSEGIKKNILSKLEQFELNGYATYGTFTDIEVNNH